MLSTAG
jgi:hypothetical protein